MNQKGFINILLIIIVVALVGAGVYVISNRQAPLPVPTPTHTPSNPIATPPSIIITPDGGKKVTTVEDVSNYYGSGGYFRCSRPIKAKVTRYIPPANMVVTPNIPNIVPLDSNEATMYCKLDPSVGLPLENEGKVTVLQMSDVQTLISQYSAGEVQLRALKFSYIQDKKFMERLLPIFKGRDIGCIIVLQTPRESKVYVEDENLQTFEELNYATFTDYLNKASPEDKKLFLANLH